MSDNKSAVCCVCAWSDLLGFGTALHKGNWDDIAPVRTALNRVRRLEQAILSSASDLETVLLINDGVARNLDFRPDFGLYSLMGWLRDLWICHTRINDGERRHKKPGIRTVLTAGQRLSYNDGDKSAKKVILARNSNYTAADVDALYLPSHARKTTIYSPLEFQMNLAFAKAYALEVLGNKGGLCGDAFFVDHSVLEFLTTTVNDTKFRFITRNNKPAMRPARIDYLDDSDYKVLRLLTPNHNAVYEENGYIVLDPTPIQNEHGTVWKLRRILYPFSRMLIPGAPDIDLFGSEKL
jgi:hypothetical protein